ncbi:MAG: hypothetical protein V3T64_12915 [Myxococcota bacterium]
MTTEQALKDYLASRGMIPRELPRSEWYRENWVRVAMWGRRVPVFPVYGFKESLFIHDIHHLLSGYDTDWTGELEIAAWELSSGGCGRYFLYWMDRIVFTILGLIFAPRATCRAFRRGRRHQNIFRRDPEEVMSTEIDELRRMTLSPKSPSEGPQVHGPSRA